jgi:hypothetical protein
MAGIAHALWALQQQAQLPIMHLRTINPMVASMLESSTAGAAQGGIYMPRQAGPAARTSLLGLVVARTGVSAFAFQVSVGPPAEPSGYIMRGGTGCRSPQ